MKYKILCVLLALLLLAGLCGCMQAQDTPPVDLPIHTLASTEHEPVSTAPVQESTGAPETPETVQTEAETEPETTAAVITEAETESEAQLLDEDGWYNSKEEVALYIHQYGKLPGNYISKRDAEALGWPGGSLEPYAPGKSIGGSRFGNYEGLLPDARNRKWTECDIDTAGKSSRGAKRIVFSNDGLIYYTDDHYESFELLYGNP